MSDRLRPDPVRTAGPVPDAEKEARIEQLLLAGLDQYFAGQYEQAINIWTRVVFLERGHDRARAYIERARGALAERHRESDELLHRGIAAFNSGETDAARDLITQAVEQGGPHDAALVLLERLNRLATPAASAEAPPTAPLERRAKPTRDADTPDRHTWRIRLAAGLARATGALAVAVVTGMPLPQWLAAPAASPQEHLAAPPVEPLPIARSSERLIARARSMQAGGHLYDALRMLESVALADPLRPEADRIRGEVQRRLLETAAAPGAAR
jgi:hypothetical protein